MSARQLRWQCPHCGTEGWFTAAALHILDPRRDHDRPDGRHCSKVERTVERAA